MSFDTSVLAVIETEGAASAPEAGAPMPIG